MVKKQPEKWLKMEIEADAQVMDALRRGFDTITIATCGNYGVAVAMAASLVLGMVLGGSVARDFYPLAPENGVAEVATLQDFDDFPQGSLGTILASYQPEEGNGT